jgi:hypothetical protein
MTQTKAYEASELLPLSALAIALAPPLCSAFVTR